MEAILDDASLLDSLESLTIGGSTQLDDLQLAHIYPGQITRFYASIYEALKQILSKAVNTNILQISCWRLPESFLPIILSLPHLQTLNLECCMVFREIGQDDGYSHTQSSSILNSRIDSTPLFEELPWSFLRGLTNLRVLSLIVHHNRSIVRAAIPFPPSVNPFATLERFLASRLGPEDIDAINSWIATAKTTIGRLRFTHFKLVAIYGFSEAQVITLLNAVSGAPIRYFSLDGVGCVEPDLFRRIAAALPDLEVLSLQHRTFFLHDMMAIWPAPLYEYANALKSELFPNLKHFIWDLRCDEYEYPGLYYAALENGYRQEDIVGIEEPPGDLGDPYREMDDVEEEWSRVCKLFALYCRTLQTVTFLSGGLLLVQCAINRDSDGNVSVRLDYKGHTLKMEVCDPETTWPPLYA